MLKQLEIEGKWGTCAEVIGLYKTEPDSRVKIRLLEIKLAYEGKKSEDIAEIVSESGSTVREHINRYNRRGYEGLKDIEPPEAEYLMNWEEMAEINAALGGSPRAVGINNSNWTGGVLGKWIAGKFGKKVSEKTTYNIMHRLKYTKTRPKRKCRKANPDEEEKFRDEIKKIIESKDENTVILYEDEAIFTTEPTVTAIWTKEGHQAIVETSEETRDRAVIFGAVNPESGDLFEQISDARNTVNFQNFMLNVSEALAHSDKSAVMPIDNAKYHHFKGIADWWKDNIHNIKLMHLPSYCSDLNSIEHLWKDTRSNVTHNTLFGNLASLVSHVKDYISDLKLSPEKLVKLC